MQKDFKIMGVLNVTPDSFSDGGQFNRLEAALNQANRMIEAGADIVDIGGESTRPGADKVSVDEELSRVLPVIKAVRKAHPDLTISIDSSKAEVMDAAIHAGADFINDVNALEGAFEGDDAAIEVAVKHDVPVCLMHKKGLPKNMQDQPEYDDVVQTVLDYFEHRVEVCMSYGMDPDRIILDPGIGFGKTLEHNLQLLRNTATFKQMGFPVLIGVSRKSMFGDMLNRSVNERLPGSLAVAQFCYLQGADIFRVHDVQATNDVLLTSHHLIGNNHE